MQVSSSVLSRAMHCACGAVAFSCLSITAAADAQCKPYITQWGSQGSGSGQFDRPHGVATNAAGDVYVTDTLNHRIQKFTSAGAYTTQWGSFGSGDGEFNNPAGIATDPAGNVYVADYVNHRIQKFSGTGTYLTQWGSIGSGDGEFYYPWSLAADGSGNVYVGDQQNHRIQKFTNTGTYLTQWGSFGSGDGQFVYPNGVATDAAGNVYVGDHLNHRIQKFTNTGTYLTQWGSLGSGDGQLDGPDAVATDAAGNVYVVEFHNHRIQAFSASGTYLCKWGTFGSGDGQFNGPIGVAIDGSGAVYLADTDNHRIQKFGSVDAPFTDGDFCTRNKGYYGGNGAAGLATLLGCFGGDGGVGPTPVVANAGSLLTIGSGTYSYQWHLTQSYVDVQPGPRFHWIDSGLLAMRTAIGSGGPSGSFTSNGSNATSMGTGGSLAGQTAALSLNIAFSGSPCSGNPAGFGSAVLCHFEAGDTLSLGGAPISGTTAAALNGQTVQNVVDAANAYLGGNGALLPYGFATAGFLNELVAALNLSFEGKDWDGDGAEDHPWGGMSDFAESHLSTGCSQ